MPLFWFLVGMLTALAALVIMLPWLRTLPRFATLTAASWQGFLGVAVAVIVMLGLYRWIGHSGVPGDLPPSVAATESGTAASAPVADRAAPTSMTGAVASTGAFGTAAKVFGNATGGSSATGTPSMAGPAGKPAAGSMDSAIASLEGRLAKGGGTPADWELLAKSFEFLGRPADAAKARAHQLPPLTADAKPAAAGTSTSVAAAGAGTGVAVSGEVTLAPALTAKAAAGETLFIVAKSVDSPGIPVAVLRSSVSTWPLRFTLDDSQSMTPGRTLSSAGRVTIEARISQKGQPLPASGDLQGSSGIINPTDSQPLKILIDRVIS